MIQKIRMDMSIGSNIQKRRYQCKLKQDQVIAKMKQAEVIVIGSPLYWHNICGSVRNILDRFYGLVENGSLSGRTLYFLFQGAAPEKWMLEAGEYTMKRFAGLYGMKYAGMATNYSEAAKLSKKL